MRNENERRARLVMIASTICALLFSSGVNAEAQDSCQSIKGLYERVSTGNELYIDECRQGIIKLQLEVEKVETWKDSKVCYIKSQARKIVKAKTQFFVHVKCKESYKLGGKDYSKVRTVRAGDVIEITGKLVEAYSYGIVLYEGEIVGEME